MNDGTDVAKPVKDELDYEIVPQSPVAAWFRVVAENNGSLELTNAAYEEEIKEKLATWHNQFSFAAVTLGGVVDSLKKSIDYNGLYNSFLMGQISEDDFAAEASSFTVEPIEIEARELYDKIDVLVTYTQSEFTKSELSEIFHAPTESVEQVIEQLQLKFDSIEQGSLPFINE